MPGNLRRVSFWSRAWRSLQQAPGGGASGGGSGGNSHLSPPPEVQVALNKQIGEELDASLRYLAMATHFAGADVSLRGMEAMLRDNAEEETEHGTRLTRWLVSRAGRLVPRDVAAPAAASGAVPGSWEAANAAVQAAVAAERRVTHSLLHLHCVASCCGDVVTANFISRDMLSEQVEALHCLAQVHIRLQRVKESAHGLFLFDEVLHSKYV